MPTLVRGAWGPWHPFHQPAARRVRLKSPPSSSYGTCPVCVEGGGPRSTEIHPFAVLASGGRRLRDSATPPKQEIQFATCTSRGRLSPAPAAGPSQPPRSATPGAARAQSIGHPGAGNGLRVPFPLGVTPEAQPAWQQDGFSSDWLGAETASPAHPKALLACDSGAKGHASRPPFSLLFFRDRSPSLRPLPSGLTLK